MSSDHPQFTRFQPSNLEPRPEWWRVRLPEIESIIAAVKKGRRVSLLEKSRGHRVDAILYGVKDSPTPQTTWSPAAGSGNPELYKTSGYAPQRVILISGVHGAEPEGVVANLNVISILETGRDLRGKSRPELENLLKSYQIAVIPCLNPDGRAISPDHLRGADMEVFRSASQGVWNSGRYINWQESKRYFPLPLDQVLHPGGYPNAEGFNIMHDCAPGNIRTPEAAAMLRFAEEFQPDCVLNLHSCEFYPFLMTSGINYPHHIRKSLRLAEKLFAAEHAAGMLEPGAGYRKDFANHVNIDTAIMLATGALTLTFESTTRYGSFDQILEAHYILFETILADGLREPFSPRSEVVKELHPGY